MFKYIYLFFLSSREATCQIFFYTIAYLSLNKLFLDSSNDTI